MDQSDISIASLTLAKAQDEQLHRDALRALAAHGLPTVITDGGSQDEFLAYLGSFANFVVQRAERAGAFLQVKQSFDTASQYKTPYILYTEPDKHFFFQQRLAELIERAPSAELIIPARTAESFASYPESQRLTETFTNQLCARVLGIDGDFLYGPLLIHRTLIPYLSLLDERIGWGWRPFLFTVVQRLKLKISLLELDLPCPSEQRADSESELFHRMRQLQQNITGLNLSIALEPAALTRRQVSYSS